MMEVWNLVLVKMKLIFKKVNVPQLNTDTKNVCVVCELTHMNHPRCS